MRSLLLSALLTLALLASACADGGSPLERVAHAGERTAEAESARMSMTTVFEGADDPAMGGMQEIRGDGELDFANNRGRMSLQIPGLAEQGGPESLEVVFDGTVVYTQIPLPEGTQWVRMDVAELGADELQQLGSSPTDPSANLELLRGADDLEEVGEEEVRGETTTHYRLTVDLESARSEVGERGQALIDQTIQQLGTSRLPMDVWLDGDDRVRRVVQAIDLAGVQAGSGPAPQGTVTTTVEYYDFGVDVNVQPPPEEETIDAFELQQGAAQDGGPAPAPGGGAPEGGAPDDGAIEPPPAEPLPDDAEPEA